MQEAPSPLNRLGTRNRIRRWIEEMIAAGGPTDAEVERLCARARDPNGFRWKERAAVCWYLRNAKGNEAQRSLAASALCEVLDRVRVDHGGRLARWVLRCLVVGYGLALVMWFGGAFGRPAALEFYVVLAAVGPMTAVLMAAPMMLLQDGFEAWRIEPPRVEAVRSLEYVGAGESLSSVARACRDRVRAVRASAADALVAIEARLTPDDYGSCGRAVPRLCRLLQDDRPAVGVAALSALEKVGDGRAVEPVEHLAQWIASGRERLGVEHYEGLRTGIARALPVLRDRRQRERDASRLLRPAEKPGDDAETLLRPAEPGVGGDDHLLVRPVRRREGEG